MNIYMGEGLRRRWKSNFTWRRMLNPNHYRSFLSCAALSSAGLSFRLHHIYQKFCLIRMATATTAYFHNSIFNDNHNDSLTKMLMKWSLLSCCCNLLKFFNIKSNIDIIYLLFWKYFSAHICCHCHQYIHSAHIYCHCNQYIHWDRYTNCNFILFISS